MYMYKNIFTSIYMYLQSKDNTRTLLRTQITSLDKPRGASNSLLPLLSLSRYTTDSLYQQEIQDRDKSYAKLCNWILSPSTSKRNHIDFSLLFVLHPIANYSLFNLCFCRSVSLESPHSLVTVRHKITKLSLKPQQPASCFPWEGAGSLLPTPPSLPEYTSRGSAVTSSHPNAHF